MAKKSKKEESADGYAVVQTGGKQYLLRTNDKVTVELLGAKVGDKVDLKPVLALSNGKTLQVGRPEIEGASVACTVLDQVKGKKVVSFKKTRRKGYAKKKGHRQNYVVLAVNSIG